VKGGFIPTSLAAHPDGSVVLALSEKGLLQCFDIALSPVQLAFPNEEQLTGTILDIRHVVALRFGFKLREVKRSRLPAKSRRGHQYRGSELFFLQIYFSC
jgi:hypothetical protein